MKLGEKVFYMDRVCSICNITEELYNLKDIREDWFYYLNVPRNRIITKEQLESYLEEELDILQIEKVKDKIKRLS